MYLRDDIIIKQGDAAGYGNDKIDDFVYFTLEGMAEVVQEKRDFLHFDLGSINKFQTEDGNREGDILNLLLKLSSKGKQD